MKNCKLAITACAAVLGGTLYGAVAGWCPRLHAAVIGGMMMWCIGLMLYQLACRELNRRRAEAADRRRADENLRRAEHIAYRNDMMRQIR